MTHEHGALQTLEKHHHTGEAFVALLDLAGPVSPRSAGVDEAHARLLAESTDTLPPILVQRTTMLVIDGMHRIHAAEMQGLSHISAILLDDDDDQAFLRGVAANISHGLPLSLTDRRMAAERIIEIHPDWSDRRVARATGLSDKTVGAVRRRNGLEQPASRVGQDGRVRPVNPAFQRQAIGQMMLEHPDATPRQIAEAVGSSSATARDVRNRLRRGELVTAEPKRNGPAGTVPTTTDRDAAVQAQIDARNLLSNLSRDPSLRYTEAGRTMLRWLYQFPSLDGAVDILAALPAHCLPHVAKILGEYTARWTDIVRLVEDRARSELLL